MSLIKKLAGETAIYGLSSILGRFLNYLLVPLYTRALAPAEYGVVSEFYAYSAFLMVVLGYRMESAFFRFGTEKEGREAVFSTVMRSILVSTALFLGLVWLFTGSFAAALNYADHPEYIRWFGLILAFDVLAEIPLARLRLEQRAKKFVAAKLLGIGLTIALNLFFLVGCPWLLKNLGPGWLRIFIKTIYDPTQQVSYIFLSNVLASAATLLFLLPQMRLIRHPFDAVLWRKMLAFSGPLIIVGFAGIINEMLDRAMLTRLLPGSLAENRAELGIYAANYKLAMLITLFTQAYRYAAEPFFFRQKHDPSAPQILADACRWFTLAGSAAMLVVLLYLDLFKGFIGEEYHGGLFVVPILLLANLFLGIYYNVSVWYRLKDMTGFGAKISLVGAAITLVLNLVFVPLIGYAGAAWATLACYIFMAWATWKTGQIHYPVPYPARRILLYLISVFIVFMASRIVSFFIENTPVLSLSINSVLLAGWLYFTEFPSIPRIKFASA